ncbi:hypothetical protein [Sorangium sp. So ce145]
MSARAAAGLAWADSDHLHARHLLGEGIRAFSARAAAPLRLLTPT